MINLVINLVINLEELRSNIRWAFTRYLSSSYKAITIQYYLISTYNNTIEIKYITIIVGSTSLKKLGIAAVRIAVRAMGSDLRVAAILLGVAVLISRRQKSQNHDLAPYDPMIHHTQDVFSDYARYRR